MTTIHNNSFLRLDTDHLVLDFPYDRDLVEDVKRIDGAKWDKVQRVWRAPMKSIVAVRQFAAVNKFHIDNDVLTFSIPQRVVSETKRGVYLEDDFVYLAFDYDPVMVRSVKQVAGITWHPSSKAWRAPLTSLEDVIRWAETFNQKVDEEATRKAGQIESSLSELRDASRAVDAAVEIPGLVGTLMPYQKAGVAYAVEARKCFIADEMGLGKTVQAMAALHLAGRASGAPSYPAVISCPANLVLNWKAEYNRFLPDVRVAVVKDRKTFPDEGTYDVVVVGYSNITTWEKRLSNHNAYVFDESHYCKTPTAQRTKSAKKMAGSAPKGAMILCLTGTPVTNRPAEYASQLDILGQLNKFGGLWGFYRRYCDAFKDKWGQWHLEGHSHLDELNDKLRSVCYIRRTKDQVLTDLPPVIHNPYVVDGTPELAAEYKKAEEDIIEYLVNRAKEIAKEMGKSPHSAGVVARIRAESNEHLVKLSVLRRIAAKGKMQEAQDWVQSRVAAGKKVVIAAHHRDVVDELAKKFNACKIQGGMKIEDVEEAKRKFQTDSSATVMVLSIQAAKTGHTLTAAQDILFVELPWSPADIDQTYSRLHRHGQKGSVTATYMLMNGTIDEAIYALTEKKRKVMNSAVDGDVFDDDDASTAQLVLSFLPQ